MINTTNKIKYSLLVAGLVIATGPAYSAEGYVDNGTPNITRTGSGDCLHTGRWSVETAIAECDPEIVAARDAVPVAAVEIITKRNPVRIEADTLFGFDDATLTPDGQAILNDLVGSLTAKSIENQKITVTGFTDRIGPEAYNQGLSERRAAAVRDYLVSKGIAADHLEVAGMGSANPVVDCSGKRGPAAVECLAPNRRTEIEFSAIEVIEVEEAVVSE